MRVCLLLICLNLLLFHNFSFPQDTSSGISWGPLIQLSPDTLIDAPQPSIVVIGDTVHVTWWGAGLKFPYVRSLNGGQTFEEMRYIAPDSVGWVSNNWIISSGKRLHAFFYAEKENNNTYFLYHMKSEDGGNSWSTPYLFADSTHIQGGGAGGEFLPSATALGDTVAFISNKPNDPPYRITSSINGGTTWKTSSYSFNAGTGMSISLTPRALHLIKGWGFDSSGIHSQFVIQYRKSTDLGETWSDSIPLSTVNNNAAMTPSIASDNDSNSGNIITAWRDEKYGCLTDVGCSIIGRQSSNNGDSFQSEIRFDRRLAGLIPYTAIHKNFIAVAWAEDIPYSYGGTWISVSTDEGSHWYSPFNVCDTSELGSVVISKNAIYVVVEKVIHNSTQSTCTMFRKGVLPITAVRENPPVPEKSFLSQNYPDPFNPTTQIFYGVARRAFVNIQIFNVLGQSVKTLVNEVKEPGTFTAVWNAEENTSGVYFYRIIAGSFVKTRKMVVIR